VRFPALLMLAASLLITTAIAQPRVDNVLGKMVPPGSTSLIGAHMDQIVATEFYRRLADQGRLTMVDQFARETGFDPRRDVRELLFASSSIGGVMLARGSFKPGMKPVGDAKPVRYAGYNVWTSNGAGYSILDSTLAAAGDLKSLEAALDEWKSGSHRAAQPLLARAKGVDPSSQMWGVSTRFAGFLADHLPRSASGIDFSKIAKGLDDTWFEASFSGGVQAGIHGVAATDQDAINLRDAVKGLIGFGRLSVPENQPEMLKLWDGITVDQQGRAIAIEADVPQSLADQMMRMLTSPALGRGRGRGR